MADQLSTAGERSAERNIDLYPWFQFARNLLFWQAIWFLYFQEQLSAAEAIVLAAVYDIATTVLEVPSGYLSDRIGRRITLILAAFAGIAGALLLALGSTFHEFAIAQICLGISMAFISGTDSALLYESLTRSGRAGEIEHHELSAWRYSFAALAISAVSGGLLASASPVWAFLATAAASTAAVVIAFQFHEPATAGERRPTGYSGAGAIVQSLRHPVLAWIFALSVGNYVLSHVPFVFGQPFILEALRPAAAGIDAALLSGLISAAMMLISVATSWLAPSLKRRLGLGPVLLLALAMQAGLIGLLAMTNHPLAIALLMLRMVPDSIARPFKLARIQPLLADQHRATYLSLQSFSGRLVFAASLMASSLAASSETTMAYQEIQGILLWYVLGGAVLLAGLAATMRRAHLDD